MPIITSHFPACCGVQVLTGFGVSSETNVKSFHAEINKYPLIPVKLIYLNHLQRPYWEKIVLEAGFTRIHDEVYNGNSSNWIVGYVLITPIGKSKKYGKKSSGV